jgi:hypothetical protein
MITNDAKQTMEGTTITTSFKELSWHFLSGTEKTTRNYVTYEQFPPPTEQSVIN